VSVRGKVSGFDAAARSVRDVGRDLADEKVIREALHQAAGEPLAARMKENIRKLTGKTAEDISVLDEPARPGVVRIRVGARGGKGGRSFIGSFLEWGTRFMSAKPWARPAHDAEVGNVAPRLAAFLRGRRGPADGGVR
jgi:HK97 gp10 family phage protein